MLRRAKSLHCRRKNTWLGESLENRRLLAADFVAGDANRDYSFDGADWVQAMQSGKFETGEAASWIEGDWNNDSRFDRADIETAKSSGTSFVLREYNTGPYLPDTTDVPSQHRKPLSQTGPADVTAFYNPDSGDLVFVGNNTQLTALNVWSESGAFNSFQKWFSSFDIHSTHERFTLVESGLPLIRYPGALPRDWTAEQIERDLRVDGAIAGGGSLGNVRLGNIADLPSEYIDPPFSPGDTNGDYFFDQADILVALQSGKFEADADATWAEGDWNGDGRFTSMDLSFASEMSGEHYGGSAYIRWAGYYPLSAELAFDHPRQGDPIADVHYDQSTGDVTVIADVDLTSLYIRRGSEPMRSVVVEEGMFNFSDSQTLFVLATEGRTTFEFPKLLEPGLSKSKFERIGIGGSVLGGGAIKRVSYSFTEDGLVPRNNLRSFVVDPAIANATLTYDAVTGDIEFTSIDVSITSIELRSASGVFVGTSETDYRIDVFDDATLDRYFQLAPPGLDKVTLPGIAATGLTEQMLAADLTYGGSVRLNSNGNQGVLNLSIEVIDSLPHAAANLQCEAHLENRAIAGDANLDGVFDSKDLVLVFQGNEYEDDTVRNSAWSDGDWNCDGEFNSADIVAAFQQGSYRAAAMQILGTSAEIQSRDLFFADHKKTKPTNSK